MHSKEWETKKRELRRKLGKLKRGKISREVYIEKRREYKEWCNKERKRHEKEEEEKIRAVKTEEEAWKYINKYRRRREGIDESLGKERWKEHFMRELEGTEEGESRRNGKKREEEEEKREEGGKEEFGREEIIKQLRKLKKGKAPGENGIENEAWRPKEIGKVLMSLINKIWKEGGIPEAWNRGVISPIYKKGEKKEVRNYREVILMDTAYKIYAGLMNERLKEEVEKRLEEGQFGFREGRGTVDAIYTLNYIANREKEKKKGRVYAFFADLKAAFDRVNRKEMGEMMKRAGIKERLRRIMETYKETKNVVKIGDQKTEEFWTKRGVRQECPMSPTLFNIYMMDLEKKMKKEQTGGGMAGKEEIWTITYVRTILY